MGTSVSVRSTFAALSACWCSCTDFSVVNSPTTTSTNKMHHEGTLALLATVNEQQQQPPLDLSYFIKTAPSALVLLDWDDTLFPNTFLAQEQYTVEDMNPLGYAEQTQLDELQDLVIQFLLCCIAFDRECIIITNGEDQWVQRTCHRFMPRVLPYIHNIKVISARALFEAKYPDCPANWKIACFAEQLAAVYTGVEKTCTRNILSFGDSMYERQALQIVTSTMTNTTTKSIKFVDSPSLKDLICQMKIVSGYMTHLCQHEESLDLVLTHALLQEVAA